MDPIFLPFGTDLDITLLTGMGEVVQRGITWAQPQTRALLILYVCVYAFGFMLTAHVSARQAAYAALTALIVAASLQTANYIPWVQEMFFTTLPNEIAGGLNGSTSGMQSAAQFDKLWFMVNNVNAAVLKKANGWLDIGDRVTAWIYAGMALVGIGGMFCMWMLARVFMAIVICLGPFLIPLWLFRATRPFVEAWIGKLVGLTALQLSASVLMRMIMAVLEQRFAVAQAKVGAGAGVDVLLATLQGAAGLCIIGAFLMVALPVSIGIGSAMGAGQLAFGGRLAGLAGGSERAAGGLLSSGMRDLGRSIRQLRRSRRT